MKLSTSIPFYLWKNTFKRWVEYPVSPLSKILVPSLLAFLAAGVLTLFAEIERELESQLKGSSIYRVLTNEFVAGEMAPTILRRDMDEQTMWENRFGKDVIKHIRQPLISAIMGQSKTVPLLIYGQDLTEFRDQSSPDAIPKIWLLSNDSTKTGQMEAVSIGGKHSIAEVSLLPRWIAEDLNIENAIAVPSELMEQYLRRGFMNFTVAQFDSLESVAAYVTAVSSYYKAENRNVRVVSALEILRNLERINEIQALSRTLIVIGCGVILALTLGSISWLEYRQEAYLLALLRSFGSPAWLLLLHMFLENLILVVFALTLVLFSWAPVYGLLAPKLASFGIKAVDLPPIALADVGIIVLAGVVGVALAMIPVAFGLRKPTGLILQ